MQGFARRHTVAEALAWLDEQLSPGPGGPGLPSSLPSESVPLRAASGRVLSAAIVSDVDVPGFDRATMDGYAVVAEATEGATAYNRITFRVIGDALPGVPFAGAITGNDAVRIMTGAPVPAGSNAVLPAEFVEAPRDSGFGLSRHSGEAAPAETREPKASTLTETSAQGHVLPGDLKVSGYLGSYPGTILATESVSPGKNIGRRGEDIVSGDELLPAGRVLRPQDVGVLSSIGHDSITVVKQPRVRLVITGNELLPAGTRPREYRITDANGPMLSALAERDGAVVHFPGLVNDEADAILEALQADADIVIVSGGSSVGIEDLAPTLVATHGNLAIHGIAMRPSSPTGLGRLGHRLIFLLPGNPVSSLCAYDFFAGRAIRALGGRSATWPYRRVRGTLSRKISSPIGRLDYARVRIHEGRVEPLAVAGASLLSSTTRADGFVIVGDDSEGFPAGAEIDVWLYA